MELADAKRRPPDRGCIILDEHRFIEALRIMNRLHFLEKSSGRGAGEGSMSLIAAIEVVTVCKRRPHPTGVKLNFKAAMR